MDEIDGKVSVLSQANPLYDNTMKLYEADRYDFQHSGKTKLHYFYLFLFIIISSKHKINTQILKKRKNILLNI